MRVLSLPAMLKMMHFVTYRFRVAGSLFSGAAFGSRTSYMLEKSMDGSSTAALATFHICVTGSDHMLMEVILENGIGFLHNRFPIGR